MASSADDLRAFVDILYEASLEPERLPAFLRGLAEAFGTDRGQFLICDRTLRRFSVNVMVGFGDDEPARFEHEYAFRDEQAPWVPQGRETIKETAYFRQRLVSEGIGDALWLRTEDADGRIAALGLYRTTGQAPFDEADKARLEHLRPHLPHALRLLVRIADLETRHSVAAGLMDGMAAGAVVTDAAAHVLFTNRAADLLLQKADGIRLHNGVLHAVVNRQSRQLHARIADRACAARDGRGAAPTSLILDRPGGRRPIGCIIQPLAVRTGRLSGRKALVHVHLVPFDQMVVPPVEVLRGLFGLTPAEAALLQGLMKDKTIEDYAQERGVSVTTVRTQLAHLFRKTDTNRQTELVRLAVAVAGFAAAGHSEY